VGGEDLHQVAEADEHCERALRLVVEAALHLGMDRIHILVGNPAP
jgi:hypothetical protein